MDVVLREVTNSTEAAKSARNVKRVYKKEDIYRVYMVAIFRGFKFSFLEGKSLIWKFSWYLFSLHALSFC